MMTLPVNKNLEDLFNMDPIDVHSMSADEIKENIKEINTFEKKFDEATDLSESDKELDTIAEKAMTTFQDLMDFGMNVEARLAAPIFEAATKLMGHALTAKTNKIEKKLKLMDLQLKERRTIVLEKEGGLHNQIEGEGTLLDRNQLLKLIKDSSNEKPADNKS